MDFVYPIAFWLVFVALPAVLVGRRRGSWAAGSLAAGAVVVVPFALSISLALCGGLLGYGSGEAAERWDAYAIAVGLPAGYVLAIWLSLRLTRARQRGADETQGSRYLPRSMPRPRFDLPIRS